MNTQVRHEYQRACAYLGAFQDCLDSLERLGLTEPWSTALRQDVRRLNGALQAGLDDTERRVGSRSEGVTAPEQTPPTAVEVWAALLSSTTASRQDRKHDR